MNIKSIYKTIMSSLIFLGIAHGLHAESLPDSSLSPQAPVIGNHPVVTPSAPSLNAKAFILIDVDSGKIIAEKNSALRLPPASLTKMMTLYVVSRALKAEQIHLSDRVRVSQTAWKTSGSRMFIKEGQDVSVEELLKGVIVDSGNDACVALAEYVGSSEKSFTEIMNQQAKALGMLQSNFTDSTGLPDPNHYTTAKDLAILGRALVRDFPEYYNWYKQKWFTFNNIRQPNRNRLLWRDNSVDGIKTGHTDEAGLCLVSSAKRNDMRLLAVVLNAPSDSSRADDSQRLLNYGFRFFETHQLFKAGQSVTELPVYKGITQSMRLGILNDTFITVPGGQYQKLTISTNVPKYLEAPVVKGHQTGELVIQFDGKTLETQPLYTLDTVDAGGSYVYAKDSLRLMINHWFG